MRGMADENEGDGRRKFDQSNYVKCNLVRQSLNRCSTNTQNRTGNIFGLGLRRVAAQK